MALQTARGILSSILDRIRPARDPQPPDLGEFDNALRVYFDNVNARAQELANGTIDADAWRMDMAQEIRILFTRARAIGAGGWDNLTRQDMDALSSALQEQLAYLDRWARELRQEVPSVQSIASRARMYGRAARRMLFEAYNMAFGMPPLPFYPAENTQCHSNCQCAWRIEKLPGRGNFDCYWERSPVDSCETCRARERAAYPLQIRNGRVPRITIAATNPRRYAN